MNVISLFDGISCAKVALQRVGINVERYFASEIDKYAIEVASKNHPDIMHIGNVTGIQGDLKQKKPKYLFWHDKNGIINSVYTGGVDLLVGGSPCQDLSIAKNNRKGLAGEKSSLFWDYVRILEQVKPKYFILENVNSMPREARDIISKTLGVEPIMINAALVSAQSRKRLFWTNIPNIVLPDDKHIYLKDIIVDGYTDDLKSLCITASYYKKNEQNFLEKRDGQMIVREATKKGYAVVNEGDAVDISFPTSKTRRGRVGNKVKNLMTSQNIAVYTKGELRKLHPVECERLQCLPDEYTTGLSNTQRYKTLGNAFNVDVMAHILSFIPKQ